MGVKKQPQEFSDLITCKMIDLIIELSALNTLVQSMTFQIDNCLEAIISINKPKDCFLNNVFRFQHKKSQ